MRTTANFLALCAVLMSGTLAQPPALAAEAALVQTDQFSADITILGAEEYDNPLGGTYRSWRLRSWIDKKSLSVTSQLYVEFRYYGDWRFYSQAATDSAQQLNVLSIDRQVEDCSGICSFSEIIGIDIPMDTLRAKAASGLTIKVWAKDGSSKIVAVTPDQIQSQLGAIDRVTHAQTTEPPNASGKPSLGVFFAPLDSKALMALHINSDHGVMVVRVAENSPAARAGILPADVIVRFNGKQISQIGDLTAAVASAKPGSTATLLVWRNGRALDVPVTF